MAVSEKDFMESLINPTIIRKRKAYLEYPPHHLYSEEHTFGTSGASINIMYQLYIEHVKNELIQVFVMYS